MRGDVLIERQIEQLHAAGITDITVVVGYKKAYFFYLEQKYGVSIVVNDEYAARNNHSSLYRVRDRLRNTYICSSDDYLPRIPLKRMSSARITPRNGRRVLPRNGAWQRARKVESRALPWVAHMRGTCSDMCISIARFPSIWSSCSRRNMTNPRRSTSFGNLYSFIEHLSDFDMVVRPYAEGVINEFDSLDELRVFDPKIFGKR